MINPSQMITIPHLYSVSPSTDTQYFSYERRLRCFNLPLQLHQYIDRLIDRVVIRKISIDRYNLVYLIHIMIGCAFLNKNQYEPYDTLCEGHEYMTALAIIIRDIKLKDMYVDVE